MASGYCCASLVLPSISVKRKVTVPEGRLGMIYLQRQVNRLFHTYRATIYPERVEFCFRKHGMQFCNRLIVFSSFVIRHQRVDPFTQGLRCGEEFNSTVRFFLGKGDESETFQLVRAGGTVA